MPARIALIEDHSAYRESLASILSGLPQYSFIGAWKSGEEALQRINSATPDLVLVDLQLPGMSGVSLIQELKRRFPKTLCLVVTNFEDTDKIFRAIHAGAIGYILKRSPVNLLLHALEEALAGGGPMSPEIARRVLEALHRPTPGPLTHKERLTPREEEVLNLAKKGLRYKQIAAELAISVDTVRSHFNHIYEKLHVHSKTEAVMKFQNL